ncbi:hypothetical protein RZS08_28120, partial [Arthrospira platensis SPKY1]|nr:hypothetical protein [Arthrospira platensis SPKY1]
YFYMHTTGTNERTAILIKQATSRRMNGITARLGSGSRSPKPADDPVRWGAVQRLNDKAVRLQDFSNNLNLAALSARIAAISMQSLDQQLVEMQASLTRALDLPEGSAGRQAALEQFNNFHRLADDFSRPDDLNARRLLDDPNRFDSAGDLNIAAGENNFRIRLSHQPIHLG